MSTSSPNEDLFAPPPTVSTTEVLPPAPAADAIPELPEQPADIAVDAQATPRDPDAERAAFENLLAMINQFKDEGTTVTVLDPDAFMQGLT